MKKLVAIIAIGLMAIQTNAQTRLGVKAGANFGTTNYSFESPGFAITSSYAPSFEFGGVVEFTLSDKIFLQPGLALKGHAGKFEDGGAKTTVNMMYLNLPVNLMTKFNAGTGAISVGAGPYFSYALSGKYKDDQGTHDIKFGDTFDDLMKNTDYGLNILSGYELKNGLIFGLGYQLGLADITPKAFSEGIKSKNSSFTLSVGYLFSLK